MMLIVKFLKLKARFLANKLGRIERALNEEYHSPNLERQRQLTAFALANTQYKLAKRKNV